MHLFKTFFVSIVTIFRLIYPVKQHCDVHSNHTILWRFKGHRSWRVTSLVNTLILPPLPHMFDKVLMEICYGDLLLRVDITRNAIIAVGI